MATISDTKDDIKTDVKELVDIVIEDKIPKERIEECRSFADIIRKYMLQRRLEHELQVSYITGINRISKRFADKLLSVLSKYNQDEDRRLIIECMDLMASKIKVELIDESKKKIKPYVGDIVIDLKRV